MQGAACLLQVLLAIHWLGKFCIGRLKNPGRESVPDFYALSINRIPNVFGPQWLEMVQLARVT